MARSRIGIWFIGAKGGVASTATVGLLGLQKGLVGNTALVSALPEFDDLGLADWNDFVVGGHEIRDVRSFDEALRMHSESRAIDPHLLDQCREELQQIDKAIRPGTIINVGSTIEALACHEVRHFDETAREAIQRLQHDLRWFASSQRLDHLIVMNLASTEPIVDPAALPDTWAELEALIDKPHPCNLPASSLYAIAALDLGYSYLNFTPSLGSGLKAIDQLAQQRRTRHMGRDGKTGETLLKSVLAPMFARRNLQVMSWVGHNIFGNMDGKVLDDPINKEAKVASKDRLLGQILGYQPQTLVSIEYIQSMGDWKTAWDHVHFTGFLGTPMTFQFIWQGCDSLLAAPLALDMIRFTERAWRNKDVGQMPFLASFFKSPLDVENQDFTLQFQMLEAWAETVRGS